MSRNVCETLWLVGECEFLFTNAAAQAKGFNRTSQDCTLCLICYSRQDSKKHKNEH
jgi:hypothetical protein